ncbi:conjugal transfer protein TraI [Pedobacter sp. HMF7647]|uniref:Conjugal transfer protein TraI n=1 Tax=Hufsiella arboris TaxID=2695275 RepID=A0A7K1Y779_9SPHI|nr:conjugal transfer protein TraI [Hufsiella arboris]MXV50426.1 conjugal transfer protein TraI [Hufsiella arboris]
MFLKELRRVMKKYMVILPLSTMTVFVALPKGASAQLAIAEVIKAGVKKVIKAVDLKVQRLQNETLWLQNAQKVLENQLSRLKLGEIADWTERQRDLYGKYYQELWKVKSLITYYKRIRELTDKQLAIVSEYRRVWEVLQADGHFSASEVETMGKVYAGMLEESVKNLDRILAVVNSFKTQMSDAARLEMISSAANAMDEIYAGLRRFNSQNALLSVQRAGSLEEVKRVKELYGIAE